MKLTMPELSLVVFIGPSGSGKSTFGRDHFAPFEVVSSDFCRGLVGNDEGNQAVTNEAFDLLKEIVRKRLALGLLTVIDATNVHREDRASFVRIAREFHVLPVAVVFDLPAKLCAERNEDRADRTFGALVIHRQRAAMRKSLRGLKREGFRYVHRFRSPEDVAAAELDRRPPWTDRRDDTGPFDIIGDIHGCYDELAALLTTLGYEVSDDGGTVTPPDGRKVVFLGDLVDRGPKVVEVLRLVMGMVDAGTAICIPGNHEAKLLRKLRGKDVKLLHGLDVTVEQLAGCPPEFAKEVEKFLDGLVSHYVLDGGKLVVAHAGMKPEMAGRASGQVRAFALYGETTGETDEFGLPVRYDWASDYRGPASIVYGHTPVPEAEWLNRTICVDTGCVFGGRLTALRWPEREIVSVPAAEVYSVPAKPLVPETPDKTAQQAADDLLHYEDVSGKRLVSTRLAHTVTIRSEKAAPALEVMSRFAVDPRWLVYLPPTMSPTKTSRRPGLLEHPEDAFAEYSKMRVAKVICEEKHMGSRAILVVGRDEGIGARRFGVDGERLGTCYTRTGRPFFREAAVEADLLRRVADAAGKAGLFDELETDWLLLDTEIMPWSAKARELLVHQYAPVGSAARHAFPEAIRRLRQATERTADAGPLLTRYERRAEDAAAYVTAYRRYCWDVERLEGLEVAPFHLLAAEGAVFADRDHEWHMGIADRLVDADGDLFTRTGRRVVDLADEASVAAGIEWWEELTGRGGEGMVVKPIDFTAFGKRGLVQPALKCRGREYLRIIYGPEYTAEEHVERLRQRGLSTKRSMAKREFALGIEGLERFVRREPLRRVHECVFGVLALESEPVDPRL
jgi:protein phosphatase